MCESSHVNRAQSSSDITENRTENHHRDARRDDSGDEAGRGAAPGGPGHGHHEGQHEQDHGEGGQAREPPVQGGQAPLRLADVSGEVSLT